MDEYALLRLSALEQAELLRSGKLRARELTDMYLARIQRHDMGLHAFVSVFEKDARRQADAIDAQRASGASLPMFAGVPTAIKDINMVRGQKLTLGSRAMMMRIAPADDLLVRKMRAAGFVFLGTTRMPEFGALPVTLSQHYPAVRNPWDLSRNAGGSSGGSGAAVAAGLVPVAHGVDGAGSIRIPCALNGLFGIKPSRGLVPNPVGMGHPRILQSDGPMTRDVHDAAAMLDVMSGALAQGGPKMLAACSEELPRLRVRLATHNVLVEPDPAAREGAIRLARALEQSGDELSDGAMPDIDVTAFLPLWEKAIGQVPFTVWPLTEPPSKWLHDRYVKRVGGDYDAVHDALVKRLEQWWGDADVWVTPTTPMGAPPAEWIDTTTSGEEQFRKAAPLGAYTAIVNVLGYPAITIPMGFTRDGMPVGVQVIAKHGRDDLLFAIAAWAERTFPWKDQWPAGYGPA